MNFNSPEFLLFLPVVLVAFLLALRAEKARDLLMLGASYAFYMAWHWEYLALIVFSTLIDYCIGLWLEKTEGSIRRRILLLVSLGVNLGLLGYFKYWGFALNVAQNWIPHSHPDLTYLAHNWLLPVGISFYTFQTLSYTIDVYRREIPAERSFIKFALYVSFFPQLVAGPIVRARDFLPQLHREPSLEKAAFNSNLVLIFRGLFKKIVIADLLAKLAVDDIFAAPQNFSSWELLMALYGYTFQIYNDFSGYSDIAIGAAGLFGYQLPRNFNRPYLAVNMRDFWARWHISLSLWIRDYIYIPLGGSRRGARRTLLNLLLTMFLAGLWHGAALNFVFWGIYHAVLLIGSRLRTSLRIPAGPQWLSVALCFHLVAAGWLLFRIQDMEAFTFYIHGLTSGTFENTLSPLFYSILGVAALFHVVPQSWVDTSSRSCAAMPAVLQGMVYSVLLAIFCACSTDAPAFIYFQF